MPPQLTKKDNPSGFVQFDWFGIWFGLLGQVFLINMVAILSGHITQTQPMKLKLGMQALLTKKV